MELRPPRRRQNPGARRQGRRARNAAAGLEPTSTAGLRPTVPTYGSDLRAEPDLPLVLRINRTDERRSALT
eukprot:2950479-Prymnesium_polylepis.1